MIAKLLISCAVVVYFVAAGGPVALAGGDSRGGTNPRRKPAVTSQQVASRLQTLSYRPHLNLFFNGFSRLARERQNPEQVTQLLKVYFQGSPSIFERIKLLKLSVQTEPCRDNNSEPVAMSIKNVPPNTVCASTLLISQNVDGDLDHQILGMLAHELTHLAFNSDDEKLPDFIQDYYNEKVSESDIYNFDAYTLVSVPLDILRYLRIALERVRFESSEQTCSELDAVILQAASFSRAAQPGQFDILSKVDLEGEILTVVLVSRAVLLKGYCSRDQSSLQYVAKFFGTNQEMPAAILFSESQYRWPVSPQLKLGRVNPGNLNALKAEVSSLTAEVDRLMEAMSRSVTSF
jgi:hypothetical protein